MGVGDLGATEQLSSSFLSAKIASKQQNFHSKGQKPIGLTKMNDILKGQQAMGKRPTFRLGREVAATALSDSNDWLTPVASPLAPSLVPTWMYMYMLPVQGTSTHDEIVSLSRLSGSERSKRPAQANDVAVEFHA